MFIENWCRQNALARASVRGSDTTTPDEKWRHYHAHERARDAPRMAELGSKLLSTQSELGSDAREYLLLAAMTGHVVNKQPREAALLWANYLDKIPRAAAKPAFRLLRCHATPGDTQSCRDAFAAWR